MKAHARTYLITSTHRSSDPSAIASVGHDVEALVSMLGDCASPVYLAGGIGLAVRSGDWYRNHRDLDIAVFVDDLPTLASAFERHDYRLFVQTFGTFVTPWHRFQAARRLTADDLTAKNPDALRIRALRPMDRRLRLGNRRIDYIDVFTLGRTDTGVELHGYGVVVPWEDWLPTEPITPGSAVELPNAEYRLHLRPRSSKQTLDLARLGLS